MVPKRNRERAAGDLGVTQDGPTPNVPGPEDGSGAICRQIERLPWETPPRPLQRDYSIN